MILKRKYRYVAVRSSSPIDASAQENRITAEILRVIGELSYSEANPKIVSQTSKTFFIIRVNRGHEKRLVLALAFIKRVGEMPIGLFSIKTSGTIRSLKYLPDNPGDPAPKA